MSTSKEGESKLVTRELLKKKNQWKKWKFSVVTYLKLHDLSHVLAREPTEEDTEKQKKAEMRVKLILFQCCSSELVENVLDENKSTKMNWDKLVSLFDSVPIMSLNDCIQELNTMKVTGVMTLNEFIHAFDACVTKLEKLHAGYFKRSYYVFQFLKKLPSSAALEVVKQKYMEKIEIKEEVTLTTMYADFQAKVGSEYKLKGQRSKEETTKPIFGGKKPKRCFRCGDPKHTVESCPHSEPKCFSCNKFGHIGSECPEKKPRKKKVTMMLSRLNYLHEGELQ